MRCMAGFVDALESRAFLHGGWRCASFSVC
jgi:hypothetical protein